MTDVERLRGARKRAAAAAKAVVEREKAQQVQRRKKRAATDFARRGLVIVALLKSMGVLTKPINVRRDAQVRLEAVVRLQRAWRHRVRQRERSIELARFHGVARRNAWRWLFAARCRMRAREAHVLRTFIKSSQSATSSVWRRVMGFLTKVVAGQRIIRNFLACRRARLQALLLVWDALEAHPAVKRLQAKAVDVAESANLSVWKHLDADMYVHHMAPDLDACERALRSASLLGGGGGGAGSFARPGGATGGPVDDGEEAETASLTATITTTTTTTTTATTNPATSGGGNQWWRLRAVACSSYSPRSAAAGKVSSSSSSPAGLASLLGIERFTAATGGFRFQQQEHLPLVKVRHRKEVLTIYLSRLRRGFIATSRKQRHGRPVANVVTPSTVRMAFFSDDEDRRDQGNRELLELVTQTTTVPWPTFALYSSYTRPAELLRLMIRAVFAEQAAARIAAAARDKEGDGAVAFVKASSEELNDQMEQRELQLKEKLRKICNAKSFLSRTSSRKMRGGVGSRGQRQ